jgi:Flp pilus assembly protein TadG
MRGLRCFLSDQRGNVAITFAAALVPTIGLTGAAVDYTRATQVKSRLQAATDAAALAAVAMKGKTLDERSTAAKRMVGETVSGTENLLVLADASAKQATVAATASVRTSLMQVLNIPSVAIAARSKAVRIKSGPPPCILALNPTASSSIDIGGSAIFDGQGCVLHANSKASGALSVSGSAKVKAGGYCAVGTVQSYYTLSPESENYCEPMEDTYSSLQAPADTTCKQSLKNVSVQPNQTKTLQPGVYCGGLDLKGNVTLDPGLYVIKDGPLSMNSSGTISGTGVTFYLIGSNAGFDLNGGAKLELTAMTSGPYAGLLLIQDRASNVGGTSKINGNAATTLTGVIYAPTQTVKMNGTGAFGQSNPLMSLIADKVSISGNAMARIDTTKVPLASPLPQSYSSARLSE